MADERTYSCEFVLLPNVPFGAMRSNRKGNTFPDWDLIYTGCHRRKGQNFGRVFLMLNYTEKKPKNTYIQSGTVWEIMASEV
jgi:hypothetical protein